MEPTTKPATWKVLLAFAIIYFVWGSTFLAIRIGVREVPPFLLAAIRFVIAGAVLYGWTLANGAASPTAKQWRAAAVVAALIFVVDYGLVFWAEQRVPSGITAVMMAAIPVFMSLSEIFILKTQRLTLRLVVALLIGIGGVVVLVSRTFSFGDAPIDRVGAGALLIAGLGWSIGSALTRKLQLPTDKAVSSAAQMFTGGILLAVVAASWESSTAFIYRPCHSRRGLRWRI